MAEGEYTEEEIKAALNEAVEMGELKIVNIDGEPHYVEPEAMWLRLVKSYTGHWLRIYVCLNRMPCYPLLTKYFLRKNWITEQSGQHG